MIIPAGILCLVIVYLIMRGYLKRAPEQKDALESLMIAITGLMILAMIIINNRGCRTVTRQVLELSDLPVTVLSEETVYFDVVTDEGLVRYAVPQDKVRIMDDGEFHVDVLNWAATKPGQGWFYICAMPNIYEFHLPIGYGDEK